MPVVPMPTAMALPGAMLAEDGIAGAPWFTIGPGGRSIPATRRPGAAHHDRQPAPGGIPPGTGAIRGSKNHLRGFPVLDGVAQFLTGYAACLPTATSNSAPVGVVLSPMIVDNLRVQMAGLSRLDEHLSTALSAKGPTMNAGRWVDAMIPVRVATATLSGGAKPPRGAQIRCRWRGAGIESPSPAGMDLAERLGPKAISPDDRCTRVEMILGSTRSAVWADGGAGLWWRTEVLKDVAVLAAPFDARRQSARWRSEAASNGARGRPGGYKRIREMAARLSARVCNRDRIMEVDINPQKLGAWGRAWTPW